MSTIPAIHSWNLTNYARRINPKCVAKNEYFWSCLNTDQSSLKMMITPTLQLIIVSSEQCIEELLDIWLLFNSTHVHVHCKSVLFNYTWPPSCTGTRSFRVKFVNDKDLKQCLQILSDYFPIHTYSPTDCNVQISSSQPMKLHSLFFNETKDALALEQSTNMNIRTDFIRQYLSTCLMDPMFCIFVDRNEQMLKSLLSDK
ncbi:unnamed protein product [Adineta ricciae]|uniref:Uncharacterized protein n=1 Tax=Adineta ricciae TaxID=249248 RepID=A0A815BXH8_ADIRI|nr:unnamed protein product [Adineta ricciae]